MPMISVSGAGSPLIRHRTSASISPGLGVSRISATWRIMPIADAIAQVGDAGIVRRVGRCVHRRVGGLAVDLPVLQRHAQQAERQHRGHDVGEVVDEVDPAVLDLLVEARLDDLVDDGNPPLHRGGRKIGVQRGAVLPVLGLVHLEHAAAERVLTSAARDGDADVALALAGDVVVVGDVRAPREFEDFLVSRSHPVPAVRVGPCERTALVHLRGDLLEPVAVLRRVAIEMEGMISATAIDQGFVSHCASPRMSLPGGLLHIEDKKSASRN